LYELERQNYQRPDGRYESKGCRSPLGVADGESQSNEPQDRERKTGRAELAEKEEQEIGYIEGYLPKSASAGEMSAAIDEAVAETGASSIKEMGMVMKAAQAKLAGKTVDGKALSEAVKAKLQ